MPRKWNMVSAISKLQYEIESIYHQCQFCFFAGKQCPLPPPKPEELSFRGIYRNITALYACPYGKGPRHQLILCGEDGQWIENFEPCEGVKHTTGNCTIYTIYCVFLTVLFCPNVSLPLPPLTLSIEENENVIGSKRNYSCNDRCYKLNGNASQTCNYSSDRRHAVWSSEVPTCQSNVCHFQIVEIRIFYCRN